MEFSAGFLVGVFAGIFSWLLLAVWREEQSKNTPAARRIQQLTVNRELPDNEVGPNCMRKTVFE